MRHSLRASVLAAALIASAAWLEPAIAQAPRPAAPRTLAQAERSAIELKQGMSVDEVQRLLGTPRRTGLKSSDGFASGPAHGTLHWTYAWPGPSQPSLSVVFTATSPEKWYVNSWEWSSY